MKNSLSHSERIKGALYGMFIGDALAMPVHWYYDTLALQRDYGEVREYLQPRNPHPDSILWRSSYTPPDNSLDVLHDQAQYWGVRDIHYHQFLNAGENTLNLKLARELLIHLQETSDYSAESWLERMVKYLTTPGNHEDTYVEEYLRDFFTHLASGTPLLQCGRDDEKHIGGYSLMLPIILSFADRQEQARKMGLQHLALTHGGKDMSAWGETIADILFDLLQGQPMAEATFRALKDSPAELDEETLTGLSDFPDTTVVGKHFSSACYVKFAVPATLYLAVKYADSPEEGLVANTMCGGDNCGRGAVLGAFLGAVNGFSAWPDRWVRGLVAPPPILDSGGN